MCKGKFSMKRLRENVSDIPGDSTVVVKWAAYVMGEEIHDHEC